MKMSVEKYRCLFNIQLLHNYSLQKIGLSEFENLQVCCFILAFLWHE